MVDLWLVHWEFLFADVVQRYGMDERKLRTELL